MVAVTKPEQPTLIVADAAAFNMWLTTNHGTSDGVWLVLAKKGTTDPTSLTYAQALDEALCHGWIDGQKQTRDAATFVQRFTPRRRASPWRRRSTASEIAGIVAANWCIRPCRRSAAVRSGR